MEDLDMIFRDNLYPDMLPYTRRAEKAPLVANDLGQQLRVVGRTRDWLLGVVAVRVRQGIITYGTTRKFHPAFHVRLHHTLGELQKYLDQGRIALPDTVFLLNMHDRPLCLEGACGAPVFSLIKGWNATSLRSSHEDVLVPFLIHQHETYTEYPKPHKLDRAVMRAGIHRLMTNTSCRYALWRLSKTPRGARWLDVGITDLRHNSLRVPLVPRLPLEEHARWRYLLSCDGNTASARLGKLMTVNSLVLKQESKWIEFYYRSLWSNQHYVGFTPDRVIEVLEEVAARPERERTRIIRNAQSFAYRYLSQYSRILYFQKALIMYTELFRGGMADILNRIPDNFTLDSVKALK